MTEDCIRGPWGVGERRRLGGEALVALAPTLGPSADHQRATVPYSYSVQTAIELYFARLSAHFIHWVCRYLDRTATRGLPILRTKRRDPRVLSRCVSKRR